MTPAIRTEGLTKHYGKVRALVDLSLEVGPGEVFGFLGPNGAGKTTMIRTILDEIRPTSGRADILGMDTHAEPVAIRRRIGYLPGDLSMYPNLTGRDLVTYFGNLRGGIDWTVVDGIAERLDADLSKKIGDLSSGNRQKVGIVQAFMSTPDLLILDEPSTGLDPLMQREFQAMMREVAESGRTVFLSSHTLSEVQRVADRVGIIRHGHLIALEAVADLRRKAIRRVELDFAGPVPQQDLSAVPGVREILTDGTRASLSFDGQMPVLLAATAGHQLRDVSTQDADLEEIFLTYYHYEAAVLVLASVYARALADRWRGWAIGTLTLVAFLVLGMAAYRDIDLSVYTSMPEAFRSMVGIDELTDAGSLAYNAMYSSYGALVLFSLALAMGAAAIAGEERRGTLGLLLANPVSRTGVLATKAAALVTLAVAGVGVMWVGGLVTPALLDVDTTGQNLTALVVHLLAGALFFGALALAIGAWTGNSGLANGVAAGVMVLSFFAVGLLPLVDRLAELARAFPWYYVSGGDPLRNGVNGWHVLVLLAGTVVLAGAAVVGVNRRDLRESSTRVTILDRLRTLPATRSIADRLAGSARVSSIWAKTASDHQGLLLVVCATMFLMMGAMIGAMYPAIDQALVSLGEVFPEEMLALFGGGDMSRPEGFYQVETFGMMAPIAVMILTILIGSRAVAGEEEHRTMGLLLGNPIRRSRVLLEKALVMVLFGLTVGLVTFLGVAVGNVLGGLGMDLGHVAAACLLVSLLGITFGAVALLVAALSGRVRASAWLAIGLALTSHVANAFLPFSDALAGLERWTPNYFYLGGDPLVAGLDWAHAGVLAALAALLIAAAVPAFNRRDLRQGG